MNKIGIITFHRSYNYGSALQAYALQKYINQSGKSTAVVIDFLMKENFEQYKIFHFPRYIKQPRRLLGDIVHCKQNLFRKSNFEHFIQQNVPMTSKQYFSCNHMEELNDQFDLFICGSDQIWNLECTNGVEPAYFLKFVKDKKKIAYAPSIAHLEFSNSMLMELSAAIKGFHAISVREESNVNMLSNLTNDEVEVTLDPTLLLSSEDYEELLRTKHRERYIFMYMLEYNPELIAYADMLSQKEKIPVVYISIKKEKKLRNSKNMYGISPSSFLEYLHDAEFVVTNSFHATVFSVIFEKKFCTFKTQKSFSRMVDLLTKLGIETRIYGSDFSIYDEINYSDVERKLGLLKQSSQAFLERNCFKL